MNLLAIETSTPICSIAVFQKGEMVSQHTIYLDKMHSRFLAPMIAQTLEYLNMTYTDLHVIAVSSGPGSYTGLRIGLSLAKGIAMGSKIPIIGIPSLKAIAHQIQPVAKLMDAFICPMMDAKRIEVYYSLLDVNLKEIEPAKAEIIHAQSFQEILSEKKILFVGDGCAKCQTIIQHPNAIFFPAILSSAASVGELGILEAKAGNFDSLHTFQPIYLKSFATTQPRDILNQQK